MHTRWKAVFRCFIKGVSLHLVSLTRVCPTNGVTGEWLVDVAGNDTVLEGDREGVEWALLR